MSDKNILSTLEPFEKKEDVYFLTDKLLDDKFETEYIQVREKENRILSDKQLAGLPVLKDHQHTNEWLLRKRSCDRVVSYFKDKSGNVLDLGCGNGWFASSLAGNSNLDILGLDVNFTELKQAARVFKRSNLNFGYGDIFKLNFPVGTIDFITINATIQYFNDLNLLLERLSSLLKPKSEIHIIDSPFYQDDELMNAKQRTVKYYSNLGFPDMAQNYYHHAFTEIQQWDYIVFYEYKLQNRLKRLFSRKDIPFPWIKITKGNE